MRVNNKLLISLCFSVVLALGSFFFFGCYYYWLDDVLSNNFFKGYFIYGQAEGSFPLHLLLVYLYSFLYSKFPDLPWYGIFFEGYNLIALTLLFYVLLAELAPKNTNGIKLAFFSFPALFFLLFLEHFFLLNFTKTSILLIGAGWLASHYSSAFTRSGFAPWIFRFLLIIPVLIGFLTRPGIFPVVVIPMILFSIIDLLSGRLKIKMALPIYGLLFGGVLMLSLVDSVINNKNNAANREFLSFVAGLNDSEDEFLYELDDKSDSLKVLALRLWFFPDAEFIGESTLEKLKRYSPFKLSRILNLNPEKRIHRLLQNARFRYTENYRPDLNWYWKGVFYAAFSIILAVLILFLHFRFRKGVSLVGWMKGFFGPLTLVYLLVIGVVFKMEDRFFSPFMAIVIVIQLLWLFQVSSELRRTTWRNILIASLFIVGMVFAIIRWPGYFEIAGEIKEELVKKREFIEDQNQLYPEKFFFYDLWTMSLFHQTPFDVVHLDVPERHLGYGENMFFLHAGNNDFLVDFCGGSDIKTVLECWINRKDELVFVFLKKERAKLIERIASEIYNLDIKFIETSSKSIKNRRMHSFIWAELEFGYFEIQ